MDWSKGFSASYHVCVVDPNTWNDTTRLEITGGSIKRTISDLRESADLNFVNYTETKEQWLRVWLDARQNQDAVHIPLFTGLAITPSKDINGRRITNTAQCYSALKPAQDVLLDRGWYAPVDSPGVDLVRDLLSVGAAPVVIDETETSPVLKQAIIAENNENNLSMADKILNAISTTNNVWGIKIGGDGIIHLGLIGNTVKAEFGNLQNDVIEPSITVEHDWYSCPNVLRVVMDNAYSLARDDDPDSPMSTASRGREIWIEESNPALNENETLSQYALRRLKELQRTTISISYDRRYDPEVLVTDLVALDYPQQELTGTYIVSSQSIELGYGARTSEEVVKK